MLSACTSSTSNLLGCVTVTLQVLACGLAQASHQSDGWVAGENGQQSTTLRTIQVGPLVFDTPPRLIATTPWAGTSGESFYRLNATTVVGSTLEAGCRGDGCTFGSVDAGRTWKEWGSGEYKQRVPPGLQRPTIDANFYVTPAPMSWIGAPLFRYAERVGTGQNATGVRGGGFHTFRARIGTVVRFPVEPDEAGIPATLSTVEPLNVSYVGLPWPVRENEFCSEDAFGDLLDTGDGALLHVVSVAWNPTYGCNWRECNRSQTLKKGCTPLNFICNRGSVVAFRSLDGGHTFRFSSIVANSSWYDADSSVYSREGPSEPDSTRLPDGTVVTVMRFDAGDACQWGPFPEDTNACYKNYRLSRSSDSGSSWSRPTQIANAGTARPRVMSFRDGLLVLTGGRMFNHGRNDLGLWYSADAGTTDHGWHGSSLSYVHNSLVVNRSQAIPAVINDTSVRATTGYTSLLRLSAAEGLIVYERQIHWWNPIPPNLPTPLSQWFALRFRVTANESGY